MMMRINKSVGRPWILAGVALGIILFIAQLDIGVITAREPDTTVRVAHCIVGEVRSLLDPDVHMPMKANFIDKFSPTAHKIDVFLHLSLINQTCGANGEPRDLTVSELEPALKVLKPTKVVYHNDSKGDAAALDAQPGCLRYCQVQWRKWELCLDIIKQHEKQARFKYTWVVKSRPDSWWKDGLKNADTLANQARFDPAKKTVYGRVLNPECGYGGLDHVFLLPRALAERALVGLRSQTCEQAKKKALPTCEKEACFGCECALASWWQLQGMSLHNMPWAAGAGYPSKWIKPYPKCVSDNARETRERGL
jgi:hypothetical protein